MGESGGDERKERSALLEETLGFNLRSLRTLADLWIRPRTVMDAVIARDTVRYTPMVRLFLALIGVQIAASVLWGGYGGVLERALADLDAESGAGLAALAGESPDAFFSTYGNLAAVLHAPLVGAFTALSVFVLSAFGPRRGLAVNLNLVFATLTAGSIVGLALMAFLLVESRPPSWSVFIIGAAYFLTWLRGLPQNLAGGRVGRVLKSAALSVTMILLVLIGGLLMQVIAVLGAAALT